MPRIQQFLTSSFFLASIDFASSTWCRRLSRSWNQTSIEINLRTTSICFVQLFKYYSRPDPPWFQFMVWLDSIQPVIRATGGLWGTVLSGGAKQAASFLPDSDHIILNLKILIKLHIFIKITQNLFPAPDQGQEGKTPLKKFKKTFH